MELGHLLTRSGPTYPEVSSKIYHDSFCQMGSLSYEGSKVTLCWFVGSYVHTNPSTLNHKFSISSGRTSPWWSFALRGFFLIQLTTANRDPCTYWNNGGREPTGPPRPLSSQFKAEVNMSPASPLWTATSAGKIPWALPVPLFGSASDMPKRATQVCLEMWSGRNFLKVAEIASVFYSENFFKSIIFIGWPCFAGKKMFLYTVWTL